MKDKLTILIADDHPMIRDSLRNAIESYTEWEVAGEAQDGEVAIELIKQIAAGDRDSRHLYACPQWL
jgi:DNA-binding NarL/FixJ family response regulator